MPTRVLKRAPRSPSIDVRQVRALGDRMLAELGLERAELSVLLTDDRRIHALNRAHLGKDRPTDVLAFPLEDEVDDHDAAYSTPQIDERWLGDVVISLDTAERQARGRRRELVAEVRFLLAHGLLHLVGYDHATAAQKRKMTRMTRRLVNAAPLTTRTRPGRPRKSARATRPR